MNWFQHYWWIVLAAIVALPAVGIVVFAKWLGEKTSFSFQEKVEAWNVFVKLVSAVTVIGSGALLIGKYVDQREQAARQDAIRQQKESDLRTAAFLQGKLTFDTERHQRKRKLFDEAKLVAARLANGNAATRQDTKRFNELYFADLIGVEQFQGPVEAAMVRIRQKLTGESGTSDLGQLALELARACEREISASEDSLLKQHEAIARLVSRASEKP